jgi:hypothetical protein
VQSDLQSGRERTCYSKKPIREPPMTKVNSLEVQVLMVGTIAIPILPQPPKYEILMIGFIYLLQPKNKMATQSP